MGYPCLYTLAMQSLLFYLPCVLVPSCALNETLLEVLVAVIRTHRGVGGWVLEKGKGGGV